MTPPVPIHARIEEIASEIVRLQGELDREIFKRRDALGWRLHEGFVEFEHGVVMEHRRLRRSAAAFVASAPPATVLTSPVIYSLILPLALIDLWASAYQAVCFRAYRLPRVRRRDYLVFDREALAYLNWIERLNCWFCEYANGVAAYVREIASRTEQYWCPIKHALKVTSPHRRYQDFVEYGDAEGYRDRLSRLRAALRTEPSTTGIGN
ncbi:hypothetical protein MMB232_00708 [Brevundimonas subvibrioides]|uniref:Uncharacterized protein n=1 Tax=Brevundimonas subvibrioides (strain ATCC 15264 / DSM 4735 / LMG 14903 / NBRC 16000 / CB 81) TaxID=633149 RepID=D9QLX5_BRESC|nr:hypothetical protein [Brevundimonas subvibrioides]ADL00059.1 conserved hypothetical protein [Brevundimonas subvibrioides ATCC 15264]